MEFAIYLTAGIANGSLYALMALGLVLVYQTQNFVPFVNGEFFTAGAFLGFTAFRTLALPYALSFGAAILCGALLGLITERVVIRPIARSHHLSLVLVTAGASIALQGVARARWGDDIYTFPPIFAGQAVDVAGIPISLQNLTVVLVTASLSAVMFVFFARTKLGKQMRAMSQSLAGAEIIGINPVRVYRLTWALSGAVGAAAGVLAAPFMLLYPDMGGIILLKGFAAAVLGGLNSVAGAILGGLAIGISEQLVGGYVGTVYIEISAFVVIIAVLLIRPQGLLGTSTVGRV
ncbi:MAG TPA: branched-chain amino acid ABC transporter permease [Stellaceae bacterium]|nr:branched-chain amino acid ABC transporter permease [Stellaceae bacterium]